MCTPRRTRPTACGASSSSRPEGLAVVLAVEHRDHALPILRVELAEDRIELGFLPLVALAGLGRAHVEQQGEATDLPQELEKLRLPVLERVARHLDDIRAHLHRPAVVALLVPVGEPAEQPMPCQAEQEESQRHPAVGVALPDRMLADSRHPVHLS